MLKTSSCFLALGVCVVLAAACGDDDNGDGSGGAGAAGTGGRAGSGGSGNAGSGGRSMAGAAGTGGGSSGSGGAPQGGSGGSAAGTGGTTGGEDPPDGGGPDASDAGGEGGNAGTGGVGGNGGAGGNGQVGDCPVPATAAASILLNGGQTLVISRVLFIGGGEAEVTVRNATDTEVTPAAIGISTLTKVCSGPADSDCVDLSEEENGEQFIAGQERTVTVDALPAEGEIAVLSNFPSEFSFAHAYLAWGENFDSLRPPALGDGGVLLSLEERAVESGSNGFWESGDRIDLPVGDDAIFCTGDTALAAEFTTCSQ